MVTGSHKEISSELKIINLIRKPHNDQKTVKSNKDILQENCAAESIIFQKEIPYENCTVKRIQSHKEISQGTNCMKSHKKTMQQTASNRTGKSRRGQKA
jgi:hypothetical protein